MCIKEECLNFDAHFQKYSNINYKDEVSRTFKKDKLNTLSEKSKVTRRYRNNHY